MKKILVSSILFFSLSGYAQMDSTNALTDTSQVKFIVPSDSTTIGTPNGTLISKQIGPAGGKIVSDDGRIELIFPPDALTESTSISIQPTTNPAPNGAGKAYQFEPSGIQFKKPVQIIFHYSDDEAETCPPDLMAFALQDHKGKWTLIDYNDWDSTTKTLKGFIHHFTGLSNINKLRMWANNDDILVGKTAAIEIFDVSRIFVNQQTSEADFDYGILDRKAPILWFVNGVENGNPSIGKIKTWTMGNGHVKGAWYNAPRYLPKKSPAYIRADVYVFSGKSKVYHRARSLRCEIEVHDEYKITITYEGPCGLECGAELKDRSSFQVKLYPNKKEITDIINAEPTLTKQPNCQGQTRGGRSAGYTLTYNPGGCKGPIHVAGDRLAGYGMLIGNPGITPPDITIEFARNIVRIMIGTVHMPGTPGASTNKAYFHRQKVIPAQKGYDEPPEPVDDVNVGNKIQFTANRQHQEYDRAGDGPGYGFKLIIEPLPLEEAIE
jgi:hypothetical protein